MGSSPLHPAPLLREPQTVQKRHPDRIQPLFLCLGRTAVCGADDFFGSAQLRFRASGGEIREKEMAFGALRDAQSSDPRLF